MAGEQRLAGKVGIITGAARGIGRATALLFTENGASLGLVDRESEELEQLVEELTDKGARVVSVVGDVRDKALHDELVQRTTSGFGHISILVNNAGVTLTKPFIDTTMEDVDFLVGVNLKGVILASQAVIPSMREIGGGSIVHDASNAGIVGRPWQPVYGATKAGIVSLTKSMALAHGRENIRVNCICPGSIDTPMLRGALASSGNFDENWRKTELVIPLGRIGEASDIAYATLFLASDEAKYITGVALPVDGGRTSGVPEVSHLSLGASQPR
jgi:NAD(P)-dependent dehydrogenase (short-subunit alcohol dehydrogenase family)